MFKCWSQVLNIYPSTIRRRILRHLYLEELRKCVPIQSDICLLMGLSSCTAGCSHNQQNSRVLAGIQPADAAWQHVCSHRCYLFKDCKARYMDALLSVAHVELFMPGVRDSVKV